MKYMAVFLGMCASLVANLDEGVGYRISEPYTVTCACGFEGFYVGVAGGIATNFVKFDHRRYAENRPLAELNAGWGWQYGHLYLGARAGINYATFHNKNPFELTLDFKPGYVLSEQTLLFATLGGVLYDVKRETTHLGYRWGVGLEHLICSCVSVQMSYAYTYYHKDHWVKPTRQAVMLGLGYYF